MLFASRGRKVGPAIFDRWHNGLTQGLVCYLSPAITGPTGLQLLDLSGQNNNGTLTNMDAPTDWVLNRYGYALDFDGSNDFVSFQNTAALRPANITIAANILMRTTPSVDLQPFISWDGGSTDAYGFTVKNAGTTTAQGFYFFSGSTSLFFNTTNFSQWYSLTGSVGPTGMRFYVDGVLVASNASPSTITYPGFGTQRLNIGYNGSTIYTSFLISNLTIWNRSLLPNEAAIVNSLGPAGLGRPARANYFPLETAIAYALNASVANYALTGGLIPLLYGRAIPADTASVLLQGQTTQLLVSRLLGADRGNYDVSGLDAGILLGRLLDAGATAYTVNGTSAGFIASRRISAESVAYLALGQDVAFLRSHILQAGTGQYILVASPVDIQTGTGGAAPYYYLFLLGGSC